MSPEERLFVDLMRMALRDMDRDFFRSPEFAAWCEAMELERDYVRRLAEAEISERDGRHTERKPRPRMSHSASRLRNLEIVGLLREGHTGAEVSRQYDLTRERVRQIARAHGIASLRMV